MPARIDVTGQRFGRLSVLRNAGKNARGRRLVVCACDCGEETVVEPRDLRRGHALSCGCLQKEAVAQSNKVHSTTHGATRTREYNCWNKMKSRCYRAADPKYKIYGGRGIKVCDAWREDFSAFLCDMRPSPSPWHSIDREDVNGDYEPGNCRWATAKEQSRNKRVHRMVECDGSTMPLSEACERKGVPYQSALYRLNRGKPWLPLPKTPADD
jgi:hypothetical protein